MENKISNQFQPDYAFPPGDTLIEVLNTMGMTQADLAKRTGRPRKTINNIIQGKNAITADTALQLELTLGIPASFWQNLESQYQETMTRIDAESEWAEQSDWLDNLPVAEMCRWGWVECYQNTAQQVRALLTFFGVASVAQWQMMYEWIPVSFRQSTARTINFGSVTAWLRKGELEARSIDCQPYDISSFRAVLAQIRTLTAEAPDQIWEKVVSLCATAGVAVVLVPALTNTGVCGATQWLTSDKALLQLSLRHKSDDQFWFSFFHEAGHILYHGKRDLFLEAEDDMEVTEKEAEANRFAADFLIPAADFQRFTTGRHRYSKADVSSFARRLDIAPGIVVGRLQHDGFLPFTHLNGLKRSLQWDENGRMTSVSK